MTREEHFLISPNLVLGSNVSLWLTHGQCMPQRKGT
jgi:hypothetical protein